MLKTLRVTYSAIIGDKAGGAIEKEGEHDFQPSTVRGDVQSLIEGNTQQLMLVVKDQQTKKCQKTQLPAEGWQPSKICSLPSTAKQSAFPTIHRSHLYSSLYEAYFSIMISQHKHADSAMTIHPNGIMQYPDFEYTNASTLQSDLFADDESVYMEYKPTHPSEETLLQTFRAINKSNMRFGMICYGNPLEFSNKHCLVTKYDRSKGCKRQKMQLTSGVKVILIKSQTEELSTDLTVVPPQNIDTRWVLTRNGSIGSLCLCEHGRLLDEATGGYYIAEGVKADTSDITLMKHPVVCRGETHTACILQHTADDIDLEQSLNSITMHVTETSSEHATAGSVQTV